MRLQGVKVQRQVGQAGRQDAARRTARQVAIQGVTSGQTAAVFVHQLTQADAGRGQLDARPAHPPADAEAAQALAATPAECGKPGRAALDDVAHPIQRLEVVGQRGPAKQPTLGNVGRAQPGLAAPALDAFKHGRLFTADVGAGTAPQLNSGQRTGWVGLKQRQLMRQDGAAAGVFITQVQHHRFNAHHLGGHQHTF